MKYFPRDFFDIETAMSPEEVTDLLKTAIEPRKLFRFSWNHAVFEGELMDSGFKICRIIHYRNSFLPVLRGKFHASPSGCTVSIDMRLNRFAAGFMCFWLGFAGIAMLSAILGLLVGKTQSPLNVVVPTGMFVFGCGLVSGGFWFEAKKQKRLLIEMFEKR